MGRKLVIPRFFRGIQRPAQTLEIRKFLGTSENAVRIQLAVSPTVFLLLRFAHAAQRVVKSPPAFARLVRANLMHFKTIHDLARPRPPPPARQPRHPINWTSRCV